MFHDESLICDYQAIQQTWFLKGKQCKIPTHGKRRGAKLIGCLNYETGEILCQENETDTILRIYRLCFEVLLTGKEYLSNSGHCSDSPCQAFKTVP